MKKLLFDLSATQPVSGNKFHGGSEYAKTVFMKTCEMLPHDVSLEIFYNPQRDFEKFILELCKNNQIITNTCSNNIELTELLNKKRFNIFYSALPYAYTDIAIPPETKFIYTIHGLRELEYPIDRYEAKYKKSNLKNIIKRTIFFLVFSLWKEHKIKKSRDGFKKLFSVTKNQTIITISNHSKYAIDYFFPEIGNSIINIFYSPAKIYNLPPNEKSNVLGELTIESKKYILLIGGNRFIKGAWRACRVLSHLLHDNSKLPVDIKVLVLGVSHKKPYQKTTKYNGRFVFADYVSGDDLEVLYKNAFLFLYPTLNEGFGYPPLEAMKYGIPCACSANSAVTEICGDAVLYFNPQDETEMSIRVLQSFDKKIRNELKEKSLFRYQFIKTQQDQDLKRLVQVIMGNDLRSPTSE